MRTNDEIREAVKYVKSLYCYDFIEDRAAVIALEVLERRLNLVGERSVGERSVGG